MADQTVIFARAKHIGKKKFASGLEYPIVIHPEITKIWSDETESMISRKSWAWESMKCIYAELSVAHFVVGIKMGIWEEKFPREKVLRIKWLKKKYEVCWS